jgi:two-component system chemotaxis response regulator CheY
MMEDASHLHELLEVLEGRVLNLDKSDDTSASVHRLFQSAHNLKSGLAMAGLARASKLFHTLEDGLDEVRRGRQGWSSAWADAVLETVDRVRDCLDQGHDGGLDLELSVPQASDRNNLSLTPEETQAAAGASARGHRLYRIEKLFSPGLSREDFEGHIIRDDIRDSGMPLSVHPEWEGYAQATGDVIVRFLFSSASTHETLSELFFDPLIELPVPAPPPPRYRLLVVDDDPTSVQVVRRGVDSWGDVAVANDGTQGVEVFRQSFAERAPFDVVILDLDMPRLDGHGALVAMREFEESQGIFGLDRCRVFINTASQDYNKVRSSFRYQADRYFIKPLSVNQIRRHLDTGLAWLEARRRGTA